MSTLQNVGEPTASVTSETLTSQDERRRRRMAALKLAEGLWRDRTDVSKDGVEHQEQLRIEWD